MPIFGLVHALSMWLKWTLGQKELIFFSFCGICQDASVVLKWCNFKKKFSYLSQEIRSSEVCLFADPLLTVCEEKIFSVRSMIDFCFSMTTKTFDQSNLEAVVALLNHFHSCKVSSTEQHQQQQQQLHNCSGILARVNSISKFEAKLWINLSNLQSHRLLRLLWLVKFRLGTISMLSSDLNCSL